MRVSQHDPHFKSEKSKCQHSLFKDHFSISKKQIEIVLNSACLILFIWFGYKAFFELFVNIQGIHYARINFGSQNYGPSSSVFKLNVPTVACVVILATALLGVFASIKVVIIRIFSPYKRTNVWWIIQLSCLLICLVSLHFWVFDFLNSAFVSVG